MTRPNHTDATAADTPRADRRRRHPRYTCEAVCWCCRPGDRPRRPWPAAVRDLSRRGLGLVLDRRVEAGTALEVRLGNPVLGEAPQLLALVRHVSTLPGGKWLVGCDLARRLTTAEFQALVAEPVPD